MASSMVAATRKMIGATDSHCYDFSLLIMFLSPTICFVVCFTVATISVLTEEEMQRQSQIIARWIQYGCFLV